MTFVQKEEVKNVSCSYELISYNVTTGENK